MIELLQEIHIISNSMKPIFIVFSTGIGTIITTNMIVSSIKQEKQ